MRTRKAQRGEVWIVDMGLIGKIRPCVIFSIGYLPNERMLVTIVPGTTSITGTRFEVEVHARCLQGPSVFDAQQIYTVHSGKANEMGRGAATRSICSSKSLQNSGSV